jgi:hypothetical protein
MARPPFAFPASLLVVLLILMLGGRSLSETPNVEPCPQRPRHARPSDFHFSPGLDEHQSWIQFSVSEPDATAFVLCLDGHLWSVGGGHTPDHGMVRVSVSTRWVDVKWVLGLLGEYASSDRWELGYTLYSLAPLKR